MPSKILVEQIAHTNETSAIDIDSSGNMVLQKDLKFNATAAIKNSAGNAILQESGGNVTLSNVRLPASGGIKDSAGNNVLSEAGGVVTLAANEMNIGVSALYAFIQRTQITSTGSQTHTLNSNTKRCIIELLGGGGGGRSTSNFRFGGGGGGAGGYAKIQVIIDSAFSSSNGNATTLYFSVGIGGGSNGDGGNTLFRDSSLSTNFVLAGGGIAGYNNSASQNGGSITIGSYSWLTEFESKKGDNGINGNINLTYGTSPQPIAGVGGNSKYGTGGMHGMQANPNAWEYGKNASGYGAGGGGAWRYYLNADGSDAYAGNGTSGTVIIYEYA